MAECKVSEYINCEHYDDANSLAFGQSYTLLIARVFKLKLTHLLKTIQKWNGGCAYYFCTIEFQHRGLPHAHIALQVKNTPSFGSNMQHIQVNIPEAADNRYRQLV